MAAKDERVHADVTRQRLYDAAVVAFSQRGFHGTSTRDIAQAAGLSPAAVYVHHRSKEDLLHLISVTGHRRVLELVLSQSRLEDAPAAQVASVMRAFAGYHAENQVSARVVNYEMSALSPAHRAEIVRYRRAIEAEFRTIVRRGVGAGVFHTNDPSMAAAALTSLGIDVARWYREKGIWTPAEIGDFYADLALRILGVNS